MSRIPQRGSQRNPPSPTKPSAPSPRSRTISTGPSLASPSSRIRTKSTAARPPSSPLKPAQDDPKTPALSMKEAIALKRAEAKKIQRPSPLDDLGTLQDAIPNAAQPEEEDILGRAPLRETIERAKSSGSINLSTRQLACIPTALFEIHLGIVPERLKSVPDEPPLPPAPEPPVGRKHRGPAWYETHDLEIIKAWGNDIAEVQPEIALFGSLKSIDLHKNKLASLPNEFADLASLAILDLSHNFLTTLPADLFSLPALSNLNVSHNRLTGLPFSAPFSRRPGQRTQKASLGGGGLFGPQVVRATTPLPKLAILDASNNAFSAADVDLDIPKGLISLDLSENALGDPVSVAKLFTALSKLAKLKNLCLAKATGVDDALFSDLPASASPIFPSLSVLDLAETSASEAGARTALESKLAQTLSFDVTNDDPAPRTTRVVVGKKVLREQWELEADRRAKLRGKAVAPDEGIAFSDAKPSAKPSATKPVAAPKPVVKEAWELEAEAGLLTEGGRRRARAAAAGANKANDAGLGLGEPPRQPSKALASIISDAQYYNPRTDTLTLPATTAPPKAAKHARAFSLALDRTAPARATDVSLPTATLPLTMIAAQSFAETLKVLVLTGRRVDRVAVLPTDSGVLPRVEELNLEGCNLADDIPVAVSAPEDVASVVTPASSEQRPLLPLIARLFPALKNLNLAYNLLTSGAFAEDVLASMCIASSPRPGLRVLTLRGNRIAEMDGFQALATRFKHNRQVPGWTLEELDVRDNEIAKLPAEVGLFPLDVFLVDGNTFRVPARRVWEREGSKGLLAWLRGRLE